MKSIERLKGVRHPKSREALREGGRESRGTCKDATLGFQGFSFFFFFPVATTDSPLNLTRSRIYTSH